MENAGAMGIILQCFQIFLNALQKILHALQIFTPSRGGAHGAFVQFLNASWEHGVGEEVPQFLLRKTRKNGFSLHQEVKNAKKTHKKAAPF